MKKTLLLLLTFIGISSQSNAQMFHHNGFLCFDCYANIEIGGNMTMISGMEGAKSKPGFTIGLNNYKEINERIYLKFGFSYSQLGIKFEDDIDDLTIHTVGGSIGVNYLEQRDYQFFGGLQLEGNILKDWVYNDDVDINFLTYSLYAGGGLIFAENIELSVRYNLALANLSNDSAHNWKRNYITLTLGYTFL